METAWKAETSIHELCGPSVPNKRCDTVGFQSCLLCHKFCFFSYLTFLCVRVTARYLFLKETLTKSTPWFAYSACDMIEIKVLSKSAFGRGIL
ncbi:hypothetical protein AAZX31_16G175400 [Glycine max]